jgi:hypothetical protein
LADIPIAGWPTSENIEDRRTLEEIAADNKPRPKLRPLVQLTPADPWDLKVENAMNPNMMPLPYYGGPSPQMQPLPYYGGICVSPTFKS